MQNSRVIRRANAGLSRCLSHHRRLCRDIDELDRLLIHDEFLRDPRTLWLLQSQGQAEGLDVDIGSRRGILRSSGSSAQPEECYQGRRTPQPSPARGSRATKMV